MRFILAIAILLCLHGSADAETDVAYLKGMPTVEQVWTRYQRDATFNGYAQQAATFVWLQDLMGRMRMVQGERQFTAEEQALYDQYADGVKTTKTECQKAHGHWTRVDEEKGIRWGKALHNYPRDINWTSGLWHELLSQETQVHLERAGDKLDERQSLLDKNASDVQKDGTAKPLLQMARIGWAIVAVLTILVFVWFFRLLRRELSPFGPFGTGQFRARGRTYDVLCFTGTVQASKTAVTTTTYVENNARGSSTSTSSFRTDEFFVRQRDGHERRIELIRENVRAREGNVLSGVWFFHKKSGWDRYLAFQNHSTDEIWGLGESRHKLVDLRPHMWLSLLLLAILLPPALAGGLALFFTTGTSDEVLKNFSELFDPSKESFYFMPWKQQYLLLMVVCFVPCFYVLRAFVNKHRHKVLWNSCLSPTLAECVEREREHESTNR